MIKKFFGLLVMVIYFMHPNIVFAGLFDILETMAGGGTGSTDKYRVTFVEGDREAETEVLLIKIKGIIRDEEEEKPLPVEIKQSLMEKIQKDIEIAVARDKVKAVLLEIDSPGGEVTASDIIYHRLQRIKSAKKPVYALIGTLGVSGAYYVACAADKIWAHPTSVIGSIGVLIQGYNIQKFAEMVGLKEVVLKSEKTPKKDLMSPFREMTPEEKEMMMYIVNSIYDRFIQIVSESRKKKPEDIVSIADGGIYTAKQAKDKGLIDEIGYRDQILEKIKEELAVKSIKLVKRKTKKGLTDILSELADAKLNNFNLNSALHSFLKQLEHPQFLYQWKMLK